ncbi:MAG: CrcB family protein [Bryobacteraceae bacterium]
MARSLALVALGSALGGMARFGFYLLIAPRVSSGFPWWTLAVNVVGSFAISWFSANAPVNATSARQFVMTGICGGFTTFSAFSLETLLLARQGDLQKTLMNVVLSLTLCGVAVALGWQLGARK